MKQSTTHPVKENESKALSLVIALVAGSLVLSMTVVAFVIKWLAEN